MVLMKQPNERPGGTLKEDDVALEDLKKQLINLQLEIDLLAEYGFFTGLAFPVTVFSFFLKYDILLILVRRNSFLILRGGLS